MLPPCSFRDPDNLPAPFQEIPCFQLSPRCLCIVCTARCDHYLGFAAHVRNFFSTDSNNCIGSGRPRAVKISCLLISDSLKKMLYCAEALCLPGAGACRTPQGSERLCAREWQLQHLFYRCSSSGDSVCSMAVAGWCTERLELWSHTLTASFWDVGTVLSTAGALETLLCLPPP